MEICIIYASYVLVLVLIILFSRLFQNCMCPISSGFKLGDHYRMLLSMVSTCYLYLLYMDADHTKAEKLRCRRERERARHAAETAQEKDERLRKLRLSDRASPCCSEY